MVSAVELLTGQLFLDLLSLKPQKYMWLCFHILLSQLCPSFSRVTVIFLCGLGNPTARPFSLGFNKVTCCFVVFHLLRNHLWLWLNMLMRQPDRFPKRRDIWMLVCVSGLQPRHHCDNQRSSDSDAAEQWNGHQHGLWKHSGSKQ